MPKSPIDHLLDRVDWRCARCGEPARLGCPCWERITPEERRQLATAVRQHVRDYVRAMYPDVWQSMSPSARTSIFNTIFNAVHAALGDLHPTEAPGPGDAD